MQTMQIKIKKMIMIMRKNLLNYIMILKAYLIKRIEPKEKKAKSNYWII